MTPICPRCAGPMVKRTAKQGKFAGQPFWGCAGYFESGCRGLRPYQNGPLRDVMEDRVSMEISAVRAEWWFKLESALEGLAA